MTSYWKKQDGLICNDVNATDNTETSPIAYAVETPRAEHFAAIEEIVACCEPWPWSTGRFAMAVLYAALITTIPLVAIYLENSAAYSGISDLWSTEEKLMQKMTALSTHSRRVEDSLLLNAPWEEVGSTSESHYT